MPEPKDGIREAELLAQVAALGQAFLTGLMAAFTIVSAYLVALHAFVGCLPNDHPLKIFAFVFLTLALVALGTFLAGSIVYADGVAWALTELISTQGGSKLAHLTVRILNNKLTYLLTLLSVATGIGVYWALYHMTFSWRTFGGCSG